MTARVCYFCSDRPATTASPMAFRPCCQSCRDKIQKQVDIVEKNKVGPPRSTIGAFGHEAPAPKRTYVTHNGRTCCKYHAGIRSDGGQDD